MARRMLVARRPGHRGCQPKAPAGVGTFPRERRGRSSVAFGPYLGSALPPTIGEELHMPSIGPMELIVVLVIALLVLGPKKLPSAGRALGEGIRGFKDSVTGQPQVDE